MTDISPNQAQAAARFRALHESGCFVLPNPWDAGTAIYLQHLGFKALATTSAGFAFSKGLPDSVSAVGRDEMLGHIRELAAATTLPLNADFQTGYADDPEGVAKNVTLCLATGVAGLSIEDATGDSSRPLYEFDFAVERVKAARKAIDVSGIPVVLTARCEAWLVRQPEAFNTVLKRLTAYAGAGADCLYAPGTSDQDEIAAIVKAVAPLPVNVLAFTPSPVFSFSRLADLGVRRISLGSALARIAWGAFKRAAESINETGTFESLAGAAPFNDLNDVFVSRG